MLPTQDNPDTSVRRLLLRERRALALREHLIVVVLGLVAIGPALQALAYGHVSFGLSVPAGTACFFLRALSGVLPHGPKAPAADLSASRLSLVYMGMPNPLQDFAAQLDDQLSFLEDSAERFDNGTESEAKRLAVSLRVLLHSAGRSVALLEHLGVRDNLPWTDSAAGPLPPGVMGALNGGLCTVRLLPPPVRYLPPLEQGVVYNPQPPHCFTDWWHTTVLSDEKGHAFSRRALVLSVADQDGGAHVDANLNASYAALTRENSLQHTWGEGDDGSAYLGFTKGPGPVEGEPLPGSIALAHVRQITWEVVDECQNLAAESGLSMRELDKAL